VRLWDIHTTKCVRVFEGHDKCVFDVDVVATFTKLDPMGGRIVSCSADKSLRLWDAVYGTCLKTIRGHTEVVYSCCFTPDGSRIASSSADRTVRLWDAIEGHLIYIFRGHLSSVLSCSFSATGKYLMTSSDFGERAIKLWYVVLTCVFAVLARGSVVPYIYMC
jgi:WD40 repeat protein